MYVIMIGMVVVIVNMACHIFGLISDSMVTLGVTQVFQVVAMVMEFIGCTCICVYGVEESKKLTKQLHNVFLELIYKIDYDPRAMRVLRMIQEYVSE